MKYTVSVGKFTVEFGNEGSILSKANEGGDEVFIGRINYVEGEALIEFAKEVKRLRDLVC